MKSAERTGVCILNWNSSAVLIDCIAAVSRAFAERCFELVVVDNASSDDSIRLLQERCPGIALIHNKVNLGFAAGNNVGAQYLLDRHCDLLLFVNPDVMLTKTAVDALIGALHEHECVGCVGGDAGQGSGVCRNRPTALQEIVLYGPLKALPFAERLWAEHTAPIREYDGVCETYAIGGACMLFRSRAFEEISGFDEATFLYAEEFIIAERLISAGWRTLYVPAAKYPHIGGHSTGKIFFRRRLHFIRSEHYFLTRYCGWSALAGGLLIAYRYVEWLPYVTLGWCMSRGRALLKHHGQRAGQEHSRYSD